MPPSTFLTPKPPSLLRVSESQAISSSSSFISSTTSTSSLFDRISGASSGCLTDISSPCTPSTAEFGNEQGEVSVTQPSDSSIKEPTSLASRGGRHDRALSSPQSRLPRLTNLSLINQSGRLDRACALRPRSSARSYSEKGTPFLSLIPTAVAMNKDRRYRSEETFDAFSILRNRLERGNPTIATRRALELMDSSGRPPAACLNESVEGAVEAPITVVVTGPDSPVEDWSGDFELGSATDLKVCPESSPDVNVIVQQLSTESELDEDWLITPEIAAAHSSILFPSMSDCSLDEIEQDMESSPIIPESFLKFPLKPVLEPVTSDSPCSPFILGTPDLSSKLEDSSSSLSTLMAESPSSPISLPTSVSLDEDQLARIMRTLLSIPTRTRQPFSGSPEGDVDAVTVMHLEIASTFAAGRSHPHASQTRTLVGLGVAMPAIYPPLPSTLFPLHHPPGTTLNARSLQDLGYQTFDDKMFEIEQTSLAMLSRHTSLPKNLETDVSRGFEINEALLYSPLEGCTAPTLLLPEVGFECSDAHQVEQTLSVAHTPSRHASPITFGKALVGLGFDGLTEASVESQARLTEPSPTIGKHDLVSADESVTEVETAPLPVSDFYLQARNSLFFEPLGVQKMIELDASQLERQSALYNLEHTDLLLDYIFSQSPPIQIVQRTEMERQLLAGLSQKQPGSPSDSGHIHNFPRFSSPALSLRSDSYTPTTNKSVGVEQLGAAKQLAVPNKRSLFSKRSFRALKKLGLERLANFQHRSGRDDLALTSPTVTAQDDPRSPCQSRLEHVFLTFASINPSSEMHSSMKSTGLDDKQSSEDMLPTEDELEQSKKDMQIGLGLPSHLALRRPRRDETSSSSIDTIRSQSRRFSQGCPNLSIIVTEPSSASSCSRVQRVESSNHFLKPSHFSQRPLYDIVEVPTPPSSTTSCSPRGTPSPRNQWSFPFVAINPPRKRQSFKSQVSSTPSTGSPLTESCIHADTVVPLPEVPKTPTGSARLGFKRFVSKFTRDLFKRSRSLKTSSNLASSPVLIEHADAPPGLGLLRQDHHGASCGIKENGFTSSSAPPQLQLLF